MTRLIELPAIPNPAVEPEARPELPVAEILPQEGWRVLDLREMWAYRELMLFLCWRDVKVRYKQTALGAAWAVLQPLMTMVVFTIFFARLAKVPSGGLPYPLFAFAGLLPWTFFANAVSAAGQSVVGNERLITKVYFPRLIVPFSLGGRRRGRLRLRLRDARGPDALLRGRADGLDLPGPRHAPGPDPRRGGVGAALAALNVSYRDFRYVIPFLVQLWMFATPAVYMQSEGAVSKAWSAFLPLNPAYGLIANFRAAVLGGTIDAYSLAVSLAVSAALFVAGSLYFRRVEQGFADVI